LSKRHRPNQLMLGIATFSSLVITTLLALSGCEAAEPPGEKPGWETIWTVDLANNNGSGNNDYSDEIVATLRAPRGALWFPPAQAIDYPSFYVKTSDVLMNWDFDTELPYYVWAKQFLPENVNPSYLPGHKLPEHILLDFTVSIANQNVDVARAILWSDFERKFNSSNPQLEPVDNGLVWNGRAHKYKLPYQGEMYKLIEREQFEPTVISCGVKVTYCRLRGGQYNDSLILGGISVPRNDLINWRSYFNKAKKLLKQSLVEPDVGVPQ